MSNGETPGYGVETMTSGILISGADSLGMDVYAPQPMITIINTRIYTATLLSTATFHIRIAVFFLVILLW